MSNVGTELDEKRRRLKHRAKLSENLRKFDDMCTEMSELVGLIHEELLHDDERNLLSIAFKSAVGQRRTSWRIVYRQENQIAKKLRNNQHIKEYRQTIEKELIDYCQRMLALLEEKLIPIVKARLASSPDERISQTEALVFYLKLVGDYQRYIIEVTVGEAARDRIAAASMAYKSAWNLAREEIAPTHGTRLGLALNYAVFFYEVLRDYDMACRIARTAFDECHAAIQNDPDGHHEDCLFHMQLLKDILRVWTSHVRDFSSGINVKESESP